MYDFITFVLNFYYNIHVCYIKLTPTDFFIFIIGAYLKRKSMIILYLDDSILGSIISLNLLKTQETVFLRKT